MLLKLAWRNLWRNKRRSLITIASVLVAVIPAVFLRSIQLGSYEKMIDNVAGFYTGYVQVSSDEYWDDPTIENSFPLTEELRNKILESEGVETVVGRLENFALLSSDERTKGALVIGTEPEAENKLTHLADRISSGSYFNADENACLLAEGLAERLELKVGDTLVVLGQGYRGVSAAEIYPVKGLVHYGSPALNKRLVFLPLAAAQNLFNCGDNISNLSIGIANNKKAMLTSENLNNSFSKEFSARSWKEIIPELAQQIEADQSSSFIILGVLYLIISFGIFGTVLMMLAERQYEFGVMSSIGMKRWKLGLIVFTETVILSLCGAILGMLISMPLIAYLYFRPLPLSLLSDEVAQAAINFGIEPIIVVSISPELFIGQATIVFLMALFVSFYPFWKILQLNPLKAMRG